MLSIVTPVYNGAVFIEQTIQSVLKLKINYEHIIVDGGSTDGTLDIVKKYSHVKLIHQTDGKGMYKAIAIGFEEATGDYITWLNSDDKIIADQYDLLYSKALEQRAPLAYSDAIFHFIDECKYKYVPAVPFPKYFLKNGITPFVQPSCIFLKSFYVEVGGLNYRDFSIIGDRDLFQRFAYATNEIFLYVPTVTVIFLRYDESLYYKNLEKVEEEKGYTIKTNSSIFNRVALHVFRTIKKPSRPFYR